MCLMAVGGGDQEGEHAEAHDEWETLSRGGGKREEIWLIVLE